MSDVLIDEDHLDSAQGAIEDLLDQFDHLRPTNHGSSRKWILKSSGDVRIEITDPQFLDSLERAEEAVGLLADNRRAPA